MTDLLIVGAGPAGLSAAATAGEMGLRVRVVDEGQQPGGQYYRQPALEGSRRDVRQARGHQLIERARAVADFELGSIVFGVDRAEGQLRFWVERGGDIEVVEPRAAILATGAYDSPSAFPGWTLPGVLSAGAADVLVRSQHVRPGRRAVVAGSGPFLFVVANELRRAGVHVAEIVEASTVRHALSYLPATLRHARRYPELAGLVLPAYLARTPIRRGQIVVAAEGRETLEAVRIAPRVDVQRRARATNAGGHAANERPSDRLVEADLLCVNYGFSASTELARLARCGLAWDPGLNQLVPAVDEWQQSSRPGLFLAGEACGLGGAEVALVEGELAAHGVARYLDRSIPRSAARAAALNRRLRQLRAFARLLPLVFPRPSELLGLAGGETLVCRCENVALERVMAAVDQTGAANLNEVKTTTRAGMGWCQGRICGVLLSGILADRRPGFDGATPFTARNPIRPVGLGAFVRMVESSSTHGPSSVGLDRGENA